MFMSKEEKEERRRRKSELTKRIDELSAAVKGRKKEAEMLVNEYITQTTGKWEYLALVRDFGFLSSRNELEEKGGLEKLGNEGWELAGVLSESTQHGIKSATYYFKRKIVPLSKEIENELERLNQGISQIHNEMERLSKDLNSLS